MMLGILYFEKRRRTIYIPPPPQMSVSKVVNDHAPFDTNEVPYAKGLSLTNEV